MILPEDLPGPKPMDENAASALEPKFSWGERFSAGWADETVRTDAWWYTARQRTQLHNEVFSRLPEDARERVFSVVGANMADIDGYEAKLMEEARYLKNSGDPEWADIIASPEDLRTELDRRRLAELGDAGAVLGRDGPGVGGVLGGFARAATDQTSLAMVPYGVGGSLARVALGESALGVLGEASVLPREFEVADELGLDTPSVPGRLAMGAAVGGAAALAISGTARAVTYARRKTGATKETTPEGSTERQHAAEVDAEYAAMTGQDPASVALPKKGKPAIHKSGGADELAAHPIVRQTLDFIGDLEAPKGYDQIYSGIRPSDYPPKTLSEMTIDDVLAWQDSIDRRYQSEAAGRYQIMEDTLRDLKARMGLTGREIFSKEMQDRLAIRLMQDQGLDGFLSGEVSAVQFGNRLAHVWAALPQLSGVSAGRGVYDGLAGNKARTNPSSFRKALTRPGFYAARSDRFEDGPVFTGDTSRGYTGAGTVSAGDDLRIDVDYQVVDASLLRQASGEFQPRDRTRAASDEQIAEIAARLDPVRLMPSPEADRGAPIVGPDDMIESGNGRVMAILRAAEKHPDRYEAYRQQIIASGYEIPEGVSQPVLIARRTSDLTADQRRQFVRSANSSAVARMSATERAASDAAQIPHDALALFQPGAPIASAENRAFSQRVLASMPQAERNGLVDAKGALNAEGVARIRQAVFARAYDAPDIVARYAETDAGDLKSLIEALEDAAPQWAAMRAEVAAGKLRAEMDITPYMLDAMRLIAQSRTLSRQEGSATAEVLNSLLSDGDLLEGALSPLTVALVQKMAPSNRAAPKGTVAAFLGRYATEAQKVGQPDNGLFGEGPGAAAVLRAIDPDTFASLPDDFGKARGQLGAPTAPAPLEVMDGIEIETDVEIFQPAPGTIEDLRALVDAGAVREEIDGHPAFVSALQEMDARAETIAADGYGGAEWHSARTYEFPSGQVIGTEAALRNFYADAETLASREIGTIFNGVKHDREATIVLGPPASGKSTIANDLAIARSAAILDGDEIKKALPEYENGLGAAAVHEESSDLTAMLGEMIRQKGTNVIVPKVGSSAKSIESQIALFKAAGYQVRLVNMVVKPDEVYRRMVGRFVATGRIIPPKYLDAVGDKPSGVYRDIKKKGLADGYAEVDNNGAFGSVPKITDTAGANPFEQGSTDLAAGGRGAGQRSDIDAAGSGGQSAARSTDLRAYSADTVDMPDGTRYTIGEILDDIDADEDLADIVALCNPGGRA